MAATANIIIEVDDTGATSAIREIGAEAAKLGPAFHAAGSVSTQTFNSMAADTKKVRESAALMRDDFGINIPRALRSTIAESALLGPAFAAAFSGMAIVAFTQIVKSAIDQLTGFNAALAEIEKQNASIMQSTASANKILLGPQNLKEITAQLLAAQNGVEGLNQKLGLTGNLFADALKTGIASRFSASGANLVQELNTQKRLVEELTVEQAKLTDEQRRTEPIEVLKEQNAARLAGLMGMAKINEAEREETAVVMREMNAQIVTHRVGQAEITAIHAKFTAERNLAERESFIEETRAYLQAKVNAASTYDAKFELAKGEERIYQELNLKLFEIEQEELKKGISLDGLRVAAKMEAATQIEDLEHRHAVKMRLMEDETLNIEKSAAVDSAAPWLRADLAIVASYQERMAKIKLELDAGRLDSEHAARQETAAWTVAFAQQRDAMATQMETLYTDITGGNIGKAFLDMFRKMVFQMVATWVLGMQGMRAVAGQAMGGGSGGILGAIFGGGGSGGGGGGILGGIFGGGSQAGISGIPGVITNFGGDITALPTDLSAGAMAMAPLVGVGLSAGMGAGPIGTTLPSGAGVGTAAAGAAGLGGILTKIFPNGLSIGGATISGTMLATLGVGLLASSFGKGGILGILGSAAGGASIGFSIGGPFGAAIGAIAGGIFGLISSLFGQHKGDKARIQVMEPLIAQIKILKDSYDVFQTPYNTGVSQLETLRANAITALKQIGGHQVRGNTTSTNKLIDDAEAYLKTTEAERARRGQIAFGPPQFRTGGLVGPGGGAVPPWFAASAMHFDSGGAVPAFLHRGEFVMSEGAVQRYGAGNLADINSGGSGGGGGGGEVHFHITAMDAQSFESWLKNGAGVSILKFLWFADNAGMWR